MEYPPEGTLPLAEASDACGLTPTHLRGLALGGRIPAVKWRGEWWVQLADVTRYLETKAPQGRKALSARARP